ncbi:MAG: CbiX/SirB N-terminal domain-containing protein [Prevotella sp.]|nr:CbiX/SirB N-terminal domain-containing protein [Prevotella sp.]
MKQRILMLALLLASLTTATAKTALVVIAHGSPMEQWRTPVLNIEQQLRTAMSDVKEIGYIRVAMMEFTEPTIATVVAECETQGVDTIFAIPLFIAPSGHSEVDIPNIIGHKYDPQVVAELTEEQTRFVHSRLPIILGPTLSYDDFLEKTMLARVREMSTRPNDEAVLFVSHGDRQFVGYWSQKMYQICDYVKANTGIAVADFKFVAMGYKMVREMIPALQTISQQKKRILVQGVYLTSSAREMADMLDMEAEQHQQIADPELQVVYSDKGILPAASAEVCQWIRQRTLEWLHR